MNLVIQLFKSEIVFIPFIKIVIKSYENNTTKFLYVKI